MSDYPAPLVCTTVAAATMADLRRARDAAARTADLVEVRLDFVADPDPAAALDGRTAPVLVTCRASWEGGRFRQSEQRRLDLLREAWQCGAEYVDIEHAAPGAAAFLEETGGRRVVLSMHDFNRVPPDLAERVRAMLETPADVVKVAVAAARLSDMLPVFALRREAGSRRFVGIAMGMAGLATRILAARVGSCWTYAGDGFAPGQVPADRLLAEFRFRSLRPTTAVFGVVGRPIGHSLSPVMHNAAFAAEGLDAVYLPLEPADAADFLQAAEALGLEGASVTAPFKVALAAHAELDDRARLAGALNTLVRHEGRWFGTNTDLDGFLAPLETRLRLQGIRAAILGGGGAARGVAHALASRGARVSVHARRPEQGHEVAAATGAAAGPWPPAPGSWDLLVNATPVGTAPQVDETPWPGAVFDGRLVYDLVYNPPVTRLLRDAASAGCDTLGGLEMLVAQAARQFELWTGRRPDPALMHAAALRRLAGSSGGAASSASAPNLAGRRHPHAGPGPGEKTAR
jgi:3-dehydroquinate dehydratase / shikimate dehydrogenase